MQELIKRRTRNSKTHHLGGDKYSWDGHIGSIHYQEDWDPNNPWLDIDTTLEPSEVQPWDWQMVKASYRVYLFENFTWGQICTFEKKGQAVAFQPMALEWTNDLNQIQSISMPESGSLSVAGNTIRWDDAYGSGIDFSWKVTNTRLVKVLEIDSLSSLSTPEQYILDGGNPVLRLNLIFDPPKQDDVDILVDGDVWDRKSKKQTFNIIEFSKDGEVLWGFMPLRYWGSGVEFEENEGQSVATLRKAGNNLYVEIRVPYSWLQAATFPIFIDASVDEVVGGGKDDADERGDDTLFHADSIVVQQDSSSVANRYTLGGHRFTTVDVPQGTDNIDDGCYISLCCYHDTGYDDANLDIHGNDVDNAVDFSTDADVYNRALTTASEPWVHDSLDAGYNNSPEIKTVIQEIVARASWVANNAMCIILKGKADATKAFWSDSYDGDSASAAKLHIEYTAVAAGQPYIARVQRIEGMRTWGGIG